MLMKLRNKKFTSLLLCMMLIVAMAFTTTGCNEKSNNDTSQTTNNNIPEPTILGEGENSFTFIVIDKEGNQTAFDISTDKKFVGEALLDLGLIEGEEGPYGLYVKTVNGITADYDVDQTYWAFYVNNEYAVSGVDTTDITWGYTYSFKVEK